LRGIFAVLKFVYSDDSDPATNSNHPQKLIDCFVCGSRPVLSSGDLGDIDKGGWGKSPPEAEVVCRYC